MFCFPHKVKWFHGSKEVNVGIMREGEEESRVSEASSKHRDSSEVGQGATTQHLCSGTLLKGRRLGSLCKQSSNKISAVSLHRFRSLQQEEAWIHI